MYSEAQFNAQFREGETVLVRNDDKRYWRTVLRSEAWTLATGDVMVQIQGIAGGFLASRILKAPAGVERVPHFRDRKLPDAQPLPASWLPGAPVPELAAAEPGKLPPPALVPAVGSYELSLFQPAAVRELAERSGSAAWVARHIKRPLRPVEAWLVWALCTTYDRGPWNLEGAWRAFTPRTAAARREQALRTAEAWVLLDESLAVPELISLGLFGAHLGCGLRVSPRANGHMRLTLTEPLAGALTPASPARLVELVDQRVRRDLYWSAKGVPPGGPDADVR